VVIGAELEALERPKAKERQGTRTDLVENCHEVDAGKTRDKVAAAVGMSGRTYEKAKAVADALDAIAPAVGIVPPRWPIP
jgi:ParB family chromosome partitioning protein